MNPSFQELIKHKFPDLSRGQKKWRSFSLILRKKARCTRLGKLAKKQVSVKQPLFV